MRRRAKLEGEVPKARRSRPQGPARGKVESNEDLDHVLRRKEVEELLHVHRRTIDYYLDNGYLQRVYGGGKRAVGISRESVLKFLQRRVAGPVVK